MKTTRQRTHYRHGQLHEEWSLRRGRPHGLARTWHKNGAVASEQRYRDGLLHGWCRQWNEAGRLLGEFKMIHGTGLQRIWHDNGRLQAEFFTLEGRFFGQARQWLRDGRLLSEKYCLDGRVVSRSRYCRAARKDARLPRPTSRPGRPLPGRRRTERAVHRAFIAGVRTRGGWRKARTWLKHAGSRRQLGRFASLDQAQTFVEALYSAGAREVWCVDVYFDRQGGEFCDGLLIRLPGKAAERRAVRAVVMRLRASRQGTVLPERDLGEEHLFLSLS